MRVASGCGGAIQGPVSQQTLALSYLQFDQPNQTWMEPFGLALKQNE